MHQHYFHLEFSVQSIYWKTGGLTSYSHGCFIVVIKFNTIYPTFLCPFWWPEKLVTQYYVVLCNYLSLTEAETNNIWPNKPSSFSGLCRKKWQVNSEMVTLNTYPHPLFSSSTVRQFADICLFSTAQYKCTVAEVESEWVTFINFLFEKHFNFDIFKAK